MSHHIDLLESHTSFKGEQRVYRDIAEPLERDMELAIYVPVAALKGKPCKVLYYLPGLQTNVRLVASQSDYQRYANRYDTLVVIPDLFNVYHGDDVERVGQYAQERKAMHEYILQNLPAIMEHYFPSFREASIMGYGFGGTLAMNIALHYSQYRSVSALAPWLGFYNTPWYLENLAHFDLPVDYDPLQWYEQNPKADSPPLWIDQGLEDDHLGRQIQLNAFEQVVSTRQDCDEIWINRHKRYDHSFYFVHSVIREHFVFHNEYYDD